RGVHHGVANASLEAAVEIRKGEPMLPGGLFSMLDATWGDTVGTPLRGTLGARTPIAMPALDQETQQQPQQQQKYGYTVRGMSGASSPVPRPVTEHYDNVIADTVTVTAPDGHAGPALLY